MWSSQNETWRYEKRCIQYVEGMRHLNPKTLAFQEMLGAAEEHDLVGEELGHAWEPG
jgi:hypothetical protein